VGKNKSIIKKYLKTIPMPPALKIKLTEEEDVELTQIKKEAKTPERTRERIIPSD